MHNITFTLGDPSGDGHANTIDYHMVSNYSAQEIDKAYLDAKKVLGFDYCRKVGNEYCDSSIKRDYVKSLLSNNIITEKNIEMYGTESVDYDDILIYQDEDGEFHLNTDWGMKCGVFLELFERIVKLVLPDFVMTSRDLNEKTIHCLEGAAYGLAYNGE